MQQITDNIVNALDAINLKEDENIQKRKTLIDSIVKPFLEHMEEKKVDTATLNTFINKVVTQVKKAVKAGSTDEKTLMNTVHNIVDQEMYLYRLKIDEPSEELLDVDKNVPTIFDKPKKKAKTLNKPTDKTLKFANYKGSPALVKPAAKTAKKAISLKSMGISYDASRLEPWEIPSEEKADLEKPKSVKPPNLKSVAPKDVQVPKFGGDIPVSTLTSNLLNSIRKQFSGPASDSLVTYVLQEVGPYCQSIQQLIDKKSEELSDAFRASFGTASLPNYLNMFINQQKRIKKEEIQDELMGKINQYVADLETDVNTLASQAHPDPVSQLKTLDSQHRQQLNDFVKAKTGIQKIFVGSKKVPTNIFSDPIQYLLSKEVTIKKKEEKDKQIKNVIAKNDTTAIDGLCAEYRTQVQKDIIGSKSDLTPTHLKILELATEEFKRQLYAYAPIINYSPADAKIVKQIVNQRKKTANELKAAGILGNLNPQELCPPDAKLGKDKLRYLLKPPQLKPQEWCDNRQFLSDILLGKVQRTSIKGMRGDTIQVVTSGGRWTDKFIEECMHYDVQPIGPMAPWVNQIATSWWKLKSNELLQNMMQTRRYIQSKVTAAASDPLIPEDKKQELYDFFMCMDMEKFRKISPIRQQIWIEKILLDRRQERISNAMKKEQFIKELGFNQKLSAEEENQMSILFDVIDFGKWKLADESLKQRLLKAISGGPQKIKKKSVHKPEAPAPTKKTAAKPVIEDEEDIYPVGTAMRVWNNNQWQDGEVISTLGNKVTIKFGPTFDKKTETFSYDDPFIQTTENPVKTMILDDSQIAELAVIVNKVNNMFDYTKPNHVEARQIIDLPSVVTDLKKGKLTTYNAVHSAVQNKLNLLRKRTKFSSLSRKAYKLWVAETLKWKKKVMDEQDIGDPDAPPGDLGHYAGAGIPERITDWVRQNAPLLRHMWIPDIPIIDSKNATGKYVHIHEIPINQETGKSLMTMIQTILGKTLGTNADTHNYLKKRLKLSPISQRILNNKYESYEAWRSDINSAVAGVRQKVKTTAVSKNQLDSWISKFKEKLKELETRWEKSLIENNKLEPQKISKSEIEKAYRIQDRPLTTSDSMMIAQIMNQINVPDSKKFIIDIKNLKDPTTIFDAIYVFELALDQFRAQPNELAQAKKIFDARMMLRKQMIPKVNDYVMCQGKFGLIVSSKPSNNPEEDAVKMLSPPNVTSNVLTSKMFRVEPKSLPKSTFGQLNPFKQHTDKLVGFATQFLNQLDVGKLQKLVKEMRFTNLEAILKHIEDEYKTIVAPADSMDNFLTEVHKYAKELYDQKIITSEPSKIADQKEEKDEKQPPPPKSVAPPPKKSDSLKFEPLQPIQPVEEPEDMGQLEMPTDEDDEKGIELENDEDMTKKDQPVAEDNMGEIVSDEEDEIQLELPPQNPELVVENEEPMEEQNQEPMVEIVSDEEQNQEPEPVEDQTPTGIDITESDQEETESDQEENMGEILSDTDTDIQPIEAVELDDDLNIDHLVQPPQPIDLVQPTEEIELLDNPVNLPVSSFYGRRT